MNKLIKLGGALLALCALATAASAADDSATEKRAIDGRVVRVKIDGIVELKLRQGSPASLVISGDKRWLARTMTVQNGDTINIETDTRGFQMGHAGMHAELTLPQLREVTSEGFGATDISGFSGDELNLNQDGAGAMKVACNYRLVNANLGGVGSMNISGIAGDGVSLDLHGAGYVTLSGTSKWLKADLGGLGGLDAQQFQADTVNLDLSGLGNATVTAKQTANLSLSGLGSVTVYGKPQYRKVSVDGLGSVSWK